MALGANHLPTKPQEGKQRRPGISWPSCRHAVRVGLTVQVHHSCGPCCRDSSKSATTGSGSGEAPLYRCLRQTSATERALTIKPAGTTSATRSRGSDDDVGPLASYFRMKVCPIGASELGSSQSCAGGPEIVRSPGRGTAVLSAKRQVPGNMTVK